MFGPHNTGNPSGTLGQAAVREAAVRRLNAQPFESRKHVELLEGVKKELDRLVRGWQAQGHQHLGVDKKEWQPMQHS